MNVKKLKKNKKGFMLAEVIIVLVVIGILVALTVLAIMKYINEVTDTKAQSQVRAGYVVVQSYAISQTDENPGISNGDSTTKIGNVDTTNGELGLSKIGEDDDAKYSEGTVKSVTCTLTEKKTDKCEIQVEGSNDTHTATQAKIEKTTK